MSHLQSIMQNKVKITEYTSILSENNFVKNIYKNFYYGSF